jgi:hypothetical protein
MTEYIVIEEQVVYVVTTETSIDVVVQPQTTQAVTQPGAPALAIKELDGTPAIYPLLELRVTNGTLADLGGGVASLTTGGGGGGSDAYYRHVQSVAAAVWTVIHNLGKFPSVSVVDSTGTTVYGTVHYDSTSQVTLSFSGAFGGEAYFS